MSFNKIVIRNKKHYHSNNELLRSVNPYQGTMPGFDKFGVGVHKTTEKTWIVTSVPCFAVLTKYTLICSLHTSN